MTVQSEDYREDYVGNGATIYFPVGFYFFTDEELQVLLTDTDGVTTEQVLNTDYTVQEAGNPNGGQITMLVAPPQDYLLAILRNVPLSQLLDYIENDKFPAQSHENALDKLTMITQQIQEEIDRSFKTGPAYPDVSLELIPEPLNFLRWNEDATELGNYPTTTTADGLYYNTTDLRLGAIVDGVQAAITPFNWKTSGGGIGMRAVNNGAIELYYAGTKSIETSTDGIKISNAGTLFAHIRNIGNYTDFYSYTYGSPIRMRGVDTGGFEKTLFEANPDGEVRLYYDGAAAIESQSSGLTVKNPANSG